MASILTPRPRFPDAVQDLPRKPRTTKTAFRFNDDPFKDTTMTDLKQQIETRGYTVDSERVATEMIRKLRLVNWARRELVSASGPIPDPRLRGL